MKIRSCTIQGFGKFHNQTFSFGDGIHVIYGENEAGKTTLRSFLVSMLFGLERKRGTASKTDEFHKYQPYMGGIYGGSLTLDFQGQEYKIQRDFADPKAIAVYDVETGRRVLEEKEPSGTLYHMDREGYLQTLCIRPGNMRTDKSLSQMIQNYMANMSLSRTSDVNVEGAVSYLRKEIRKQSKDPVYVEYQQARQQMLDTKDVEPELEELYKEAAELELELEEIQQPKGLIEKIIDWIRRLLKLPDQRDLDRQQIEHELEIIDIKKKQLYKQQRFNEDLRNRVEKFKKDIQKLEYNKKAMEEAVRAILEAADEIHQEFGSGLHEEVSSIVAKITNGAYEKIKIDEAMGIVVEKDGSFLDINYLSTGTVEQIYFAVRMAAADLLYPGEGFPMILDDVFGNFDDVRLGRTLSYLEQTGGQIIIFTCKKDVLSALDQLGCEYQTTVLPQSFPTEIKIYATQ